MSASTEAHEATCKCPPAFDKIGADRLADEVAALVSGGKLDSRSPAADALLDYRNPSRTPRSDRLEERDAREAALVAAARSLLEWTREKRELDADAGHNWRRNGTALLPTTDLGRYVEDMIAAGESALADYEGPRT